MADDEFVGKAVSLFCEFVISLVVSNEIGTSRTLEIRYENAEIQGVDLISQGLGDHIPPSDLQIF